MLDSLQDAKLVLLSNGLQLSLPIMIHLHDVDRQSGVNRVVAEEPVTDASMVLVNCRTAADC